MTVVFFSGYPCHYSNRNDVPIFKTFLQLLILIICGLLLLVGHVVAADFEVNTLAVTRLKQSMQQRHSQLVPYYDTGAVGFTRDGLIALRDANVVPLSGRQLVNRFIAAENQDRNALYREIALANDHPEWENDIRSTFSQRWITSARSGWWYQQGDGSWHRK